MERSCGGGGGEGGGLEEELWIVDCVRFPRARKGRSVLGGAMSFAPQAKLRIFLLSFVVVHCNPREKVGRSNNERMHFACQI